VTPHPAPKTPLQRLPQPFAARPAEVVAPALLGMLLVRDEVVLRITEVEAYAWPDDTANHCRMGRTPRNAPMWGPAGHAYVYLCYGLHVMLNVVTNAEGEGAAVLVRACEPLAGLDTVRARRRGLEGPVLLTGPGRVGAALGLDAGWSGHALFEAGGLELCEGEAPAGVLVGPRIGIDYASPRDRAAPLRFAVADSRWVSRPRALTRWRGRVAASG
jgi:DNA-3-methyladenine glycosylase